MTSSLDLTEEETFEVERGEGGVLEVRLDPAAGPAFDDAVAAVIPKPRRLTRKCDQRQIQIPAQHAPGQGT